MLTLTGFPLCVADQWIDADGSLQDDYSDGELLGEEETVWRNNVPEVVELVTLEDQELPAAALEPYVMKEQGGRRNTMHACIIIIIYTIVLLL